MASTSPATTRMPYRSPARLAYAGLGLFQGKYLRGNTDFHRRPARKKFSGLMVLDVPARDRL
jgi:hypothetical protein